MRIDTPISRPAGGLPLAMGKLPGRRLGLLLAALLLSIAAGYVGYTRYLAATQTTVAVQSTPARVGSLVSTVTATGNVVSTRQAKLGCSASGKLLEMNVNVGDTVKAGQQLAKLDTQQLQI